MNSPSRVQMRRCFGPSNWIYSRDGAVLTRRWRGKKESLREHKMPPRCVSCGNLSSASIQERRSFVFSCTKNQLENVRWGKRYCTHNSIQGCRLRQRIVEGRQSKTVQASCSSVTRIITECRRGNREKVRLEKISGPNSNNSMFSGKLVWNIRSGYGHWGIARARKCESWLKSVYSGEISEGNAI